MNFTFLPGAAHFVANILQPTKVLLSVQQVMDQSAGVHSAYLYLLTCANSLFLQARRTQTIYMARRN